MLQNQAGFPWMKAVVEKRVHNLCNDGETPDEWNVGAICLDEIPLFGWRVRKEKISNKEIDQRGCATEQEVPKRPCCDAVIVERYPSELELQKNNEDSANCVNPEDPVNSSMLKYPA